LTDIVLGIDPGCSVTGYGLLETEGGEIRYLVSGCIEPRPARAPLETRLLAIHREIDRLIDLHRPGRCAVEDVFHHRNPRSSLVLGQARGVALLTAVRRGLTVATYPPREIKKAVTGNGAAHKTQVRAMIRRLLDLPWLEREDESDGLAVAYCHAARLGLERRAARLQPW
jgi:crossover junction endodeoxyribonuclease RuvC